MEIKGQIVQTLFLTNNILKYALYTKIWLSHEFTNDRYNKFRNVVHIQ